MIIGFSKYGHGGSGPALDYLTGYLVNGETRATKPEVLRGSPRDVGAIIDSLPFKCRYSSGVLSFAAGDQVTPVMQEEIMDRFEQSVFAGLPADRRSIVWIKHTDKGRTELHFVVPRVDLGTGKSLNIAPPTPASRHLLDTLREAINRRYGFRDPSDPECARKVSLPAHVAKLAAQAKRHGRSARINVRQSIAERVHAQAEAGVIRSRADVVAYLNGQGFNISRTGLNYLTVVHPETGERVRLKGNVFRQNFCPRDLQPATKRHDPSQLVTLERRLERLVEKRASFHRARYGIAEQNVEPPQIIVPLNYDRTRNPSPKRIQTIGATVPPARSIAREHAGRFVQAVRQLVGTTRRFVEAARRWCHSKRELEQSAQGFERTYREFAREFEPALAEKTRSRRIVVHPQSAAVRPVVYSTAVPAPRLAVMHDRNRDDEMEPEMEINEP
jgi:hypothetical protein